jgi:hypothetical protein
MNFKSPKKAFAAACLASTAFVAPAMAQNISTLGSESSTLQPWGLPNTAAYGQTFTVANAGRLDRVTFRINDSVGIGYDLRIFAWDPVLNRVIGPSLGSVAGTTPGAGVMSSVVVDTGGVALPSAGQYVAFLQATSNGSSNWGTADDSYAGGGYVFQNNSGDTSQWSGTGWATSNIDMAFALALNLGPTQDQELADLAAAAGTAARLVVFNAHSVARTRGQDSLTTRDEALSFTRTADPESGSFTITQSTMDNPQMMGGIYTWIDLTGFRAEDDATARSYTGRGLQIGADIEVMPDMVVGLSLGVSNLDASVGTVVQDGVLRYLQPYMAYRSGAWSGGASLLYGRGDYTQTTGGGTGEGETRLTAITFDGGYDIPLDGNWTITPMIGLVHGVERITGISGTLAGAGTERVRFTQASLGGEISQSMGSGEFFTGLHADWLDTDADTALLSDLLVDDGWTGRLELGLATEIGNGISFDTSVELSGLGGDLRSTSGALRFTFRF